LLLCPEALSKGRKMLGERRNEVHFQQTSFIQGTVREGALEREGVAGHCGADLTTNPGKMSGAAERCTSLECFAPTGLLSGVNIELADLKLMAL
jgi:hypothetical protein